MTEFTIHIDSAGGLYTEEGLTALFEHLTNDERAGSAATSADLEHGSYGATFQVDAADLLEAAALASAVFGSALVAAGHDGDAIAHLEIATEPFEAAAA